VVVPYQVAKRRLFSRQLRRAAEVEGLHDAEASVDIEEAGEPGSSREVDR
jgi:hypothetical protein